MDKRRLLLAAVAAAAYAATPALAARKRAAPRAGKKAAAATAAAAVPAGLARDEAGPPVSPRPGGQPVVLTVAGRIGRSNRGPTVEALEPLMARQGIRFDKAFAFTMADLLRFPAATLRPVLAHDGQAHALRGPLLAHVLRGAGVETEPSQRVTLRGLDGQNATLSLGEVRGREMILATHLDDRPLSLGGMGPLWAVFDPAMQADLKERPLEERFAACPWGLYYIEVASA